MSRQSKQRAAGRGRRSTPPRLVPAEPVAHRNAVNASWSEFASTVTAAAPWLLVAVALGLRLYRLGNEPLWFDEAYTALTAVKPVGATIALLQGEGNAPLYYVLLHAWAALFGDGEYALRLLSALCGVVAIPLLYWVGTRMFSRAAGLIAAALATLSPLHIHYSQEARMYPLLPPLALLLVYTLYRLLVAPTRQAVAGFVLAVVAGLYVHYYFLFCLPLAGLIVLAPERRRVVAPLAVALLLIALGFLPWLPTLLHQAAGGVEDWVAEWWRGRPFWYAVLWSLETLGPGALYPPMASFKFSSTIYGRAISLALAALVFGGALWQLRRPRSTRLPGTVDFPRDSPSRRRQRKAAPQGERKRSCDSESNDSQTVRDEALEAGSLDLSTLQRVGAEEPNRWLATLLVLSAVLVPLAIAFVVSLFRSPIYVVGRHDVIAWGPYYLLAGAVFSRLKPGIACAAVTLWVGLSIATLVPYFTTDRPARNYVDMGKLIAQTLTERAHPGETVVFTAATRTTTQYYMRATPDRFQLVSYPLASDAHLGWIDPRIRTDAAFAAAEADRFVAWLGDGGSAPAVVWIVAPGSRGTAPLLSQLERRGYHRDAARSTGVLLCLQRG